MTPEQWEQLHLLVEEAMELSEGQRLDFARCACGDDDAMRDELLSLLAACLRSPERQEPPTEWLGVLAGPSLPRFARDEQVAERYRIIRLLGRGGMGEVYEAWDQELSIPVALKVLPLTSDTADARRRLQLEGMLARSVWHPNVCRMYDLGCHAIDGREAWFHSMELLSGRTLADLLREEPALPIERALRLAKQMAAGLGAAHRAGVIHRDLKPSNVLLVERSDGEHAVITDFGIALAHGRESLDRAEAPDLVFGTPPYMAPEQVLGDEVGPAADLYALGLVLFEMVTGALPWGSDPSIEAARHRATEAAPSPRALRPELDSRWEAALLRCLEREPDRRFSAAEEVIEALSDLAPRIHPQVLGRAGRIAGGLIAERDAFIGREVELADLERVLDGGARLVTLVGAAGMGKTRLALHYSWRSLDRWPGGVCFCDLSDARDDHRFARTIARVFATELGRGDPITQLSQLIAARGRCLIVLDNTEHVRAITAALARACLSRSSEARFLVTSLEHLGLETEEKVQRLDSLSPAAGVELFETRARWLRPDFECSGADAASVQELVRLVDGMPLAIELAAARIRVMSAAQIVQQMRKRFSLLTGGATARHETLLGTIAASWELLSEVQRTACAQCSVFQGGFTLEAAEAVLAFDEARRDAGVIDLLQSLVDRSLLRTSVTQPVTRGGPVVLRFGMLTSVQEYARLQLAQAHERAPDGASVETETAVLDRHSIWFARHGRAFGRALRAAGEAGGGRQALEPEFSNLVQACRRAVERADGPTAASLYRTLWMLFSEAGPFALAVDLGHTILRGTTLTAEEEAQVMMILANGERYAGRPSEATAHVEAALAHFGASGNRTAELKARDTLVRLLTLANRLTEARLHAEAALALSHELHDRRMEGFILSATGELNRLDGRLDDAKRCWTEALGVARELEDRRMQGIVLNNLGTAHHECGEVEAARRCFQAALDLHLAVGNRRSTGIALANLGLIHQVNGELDQAMRYYNDAVNIHRELGHRRFESAILADLGDLHRERGDLGAARRHLEAALAIRRELGDLAELTKLLCVREELELDQADESAARATFLEAESVREKAGVDPASETGRTLAELRARLDRLGS